MSQVDPSRSGGLVTPQAVVNYGDTPVLRAEGLLSEDSRSVPDSTVSGVTSYESVSAVPEPPRYPSGVREAGIGIRLVAYLLEAILQTVTLGIGWLIWAAVIAGKGLTPAKQILRLRVIDAADSRPLGFARMLFMRGIVAGLVAAIAIPITLGILLFMPLWDRRNQNLWDKVSSSVVVVDADNAWNL